MNCDYESKIIINKLNLLLSDEFGKIQFWKDGTKYTGEWKDGKMNGQGTFYYKDGSWWTGEWKNRLDGTKNGFGTEYAADGAVLRSGNWVNGKYVKPK